MSIFHLFLASLPARSEYPVFEQEDSYMDEGLFEEEKERSPRPDSKSFDSRLSIQGNPWSIRMASVEGSSHFCVSSHS